MSRACCGNSKFNKQYLKCRIQWYDSQWLLQSIKGFTEIYFLSTNKIRLLLFDTRKPRKYLYDNKTVLHIIYIFNIEYSIV